MYLMYNIHILGNIWAWYYEIPCVDKVLCKFSIGRNSAFLHFTLPSAKFLPFNCLIYLSNNLIPKIRADAGSRPSLWYSVWCVSDEAGVCWSRWRRRTDARSRLGLCYCVCWASGGPARAHPDSLLAVVGVPAGTHGRVGTWSSPYLCLASGGSAPPRGLAGFLVVAATGFGRGCASARSRRGLCISFSH